MDLLIAHRKKLFVCLSFLLVVVQGVNGQEEIKSDYYANHGPKLPEAASFGSFGNTKINYYTGLPEVSLPLATLQGRAASLPVSLS
jgi:hypothetical protein